METTQKKFDFSKYMKVVGFFCLEVFAIIAFSLGNSFIFYTIMSLVLLGLLVLVSYKEISKDGITNYIFFAFPLILYGLMTALSNFTFDPLFELYGAAKYFIPIGLTVLSFCGYFVGNNKSFKISHLLIAIYSALALLTLINLLATMINFKPFYTLMYRNSYIYYNGEPSQSPVSEMAFSLIGFNLSETSIEYFSLFPSLLLSSFVPLAFVKYKENKKLFIAYLEFGLLGAISLILTVSISTLITDVLIGIVLFIILLKKHNKVNTKVLKIILIALGVLSFLLFVTIIINSQNNATGFIASIQNLIKGNKLLDKLFNSNRLADAYKTIMLDIFTKDKMFGFPHVNPKAIYDYPNGIYPTGSVLFDTIMFSGLFGWILFIVVLVVSIRRMVIYYKKSEDGLDVKLTIFAFVLSYIIYSLFNNDATPHIFTSDIIPYYLGGPFIIVIFLFAYCFAKSDIKTTIEPVENKEEATIHEENI